MKKIFTLLTAVLLMVSVFLPRQASAQTPEKMSYQAVIRDSDDNLVVNTSVGMQISILEGSATGSSVYVERQFPITNNNGLVSIEIGSSDATVVSGDFTTIDWSAGIYFIKTEIDLNGGSSYTITGTSQLLSVPYALHAKAADTLIGKITETDPEFIAWDKDYADLINTPDLSDTVNYLTDETDPSVPSGTQTGEMQYWDGSEWITVPSGAEGQFLSFNNGEPVWITLSGVNTVGPTDAYNPTTDKVWMDRNLGALQLAGSSTDVDAYGDLYQWGRAGDGHQLRTSGTTSATSSSDTPGHGNFITNGSSPGDWRNPQNDNLWQGVSGTNNPCPSGYRLPTEAEWEAERTSWSNNNAAGAFSSPLKLPVAGYRHHSGGSLIDVGSAGYYWSSTVGSIYSRLLLFVSSTAGSYSGFRANGTSVRCIKD